MEKKIAEAEEKMQAFIRKHCAEETSEIKESISQIQYQQENHKKDIEAESLFAVAP